MPLSMSPCRKGTRIRRRLEAFAHDLSGLSAVEFALIVPIMIALYFGTVEFSNALTVDRRVTSVASTIADLAAQAEEVDRDDVGDMFAAAASIMNPYDSDEISIVLTSVVADEDNNTTVAWSCSNDDAGEGAYAEGSSYTLPPNLTQPFTSVIVAEVEYSYSPPIIRYIDAPLDLQETFYLRPRRSLTVEFEGAPC